MYTLVFLILMHAAGDFLLQGNKLSKLKITKFYYLLAHVGIYTVFFIAVSPILLKLTFIQGLYFSLINGVLHLAVDFITSKLKKKYWEINEAKYLAVVSFDHIIHIIILISSYLLMFPEVSKSSLY